MIDDDQLSAQPYMHQNKRRLIIQAALARLKNKNQSYLDHLESNSRWRKIYNGLLYHNCQSQLSKIINLQLCEATQDDEHSFFNPFQKMPITMCYNKINKSQIFERSAIYNLVLFYDSKTKKDMNWNKIEETTRSTIRALNISGICKRNDKQCFRSEVQKRVLQRQRFKGIQINFEQIYESSIEDMSPISQILN